MIIHVIYGSLPSISSVFTSNKGAKLMAKENRGSLILKSECGQSAYKQVWGISLLESVPCMWCVPLQGQQAGRSALHWDHRGSSILKRQSWGTGRGEQTDTQTVSSGGWEFLPCLLSPCLLCVKQNSHSINTYYGLVSTCKRREKRKMEWTRGRAQTFRKVGKKQLEQFKEKATYQNPVLKVTFNCYISYP